MNGLSPELAGAVLALAYEEMHEKPWLAGPLERQIFDDALRCAALILTDSLLDSTKDCTP
jgi:hypothetical protein